MKKNILLTLLIAFSFVACAVTTQQSNLTWNDSYGGVDKSYDFKLLEMRKQVAPRFQTLKFEDKTTGRTMEYNLFIPKDYDKKKSYPLVLFMADASTVGKGAISPLMQGYGGIIWATDESQAKNPSFVLVPAFSGPQTATNDNWEVSDEVEIVHRLLNSVVSKYSIDKNRLYTTGQSMGGMISFYLNSKYPDLFAASIFVGSQWDINVLEPLTKMNFFYIVSQGDEKASKGMSDLEELFNNEDVKYGYTIFDANLSEKQKEAYVLNLINEGLDRNFVQFTKGTVIPEGDNSPGGEHMYSFDYAYQLDVVRDWLFKQAKISKKQSVKARKVFTSALKYYLGREIKQDYAKAKELFEECMALGDMKAPRYLGIMHEEGLGVEIDYEKAMDYYKEASKRGDITGTDRIGSMYELGLGVDKSFEKALKWYLKAAPSPKEASKNSYPRMNAIVRLGNFYENGFGVQKDKNQAIEWYLVAAKKGNKESKEALKRLGYKK